MAIKQKDLELREMNQSLVGVDEIGTTQLNINKNARLAGIFIYL